VSDTPLLLIDEGSFVPLPEQIRRGVVDQVAGCVLSVGDRLPTVRQLARDLALAPGTVARAYQLLEADGVIETRGRRGSFVAVSAASLTGSPDGALEQLEEAARRYLAEALRLGLSPDTAIDVVTRSATAVAPRSVSSNDG
jgi:DNA-binding transcriptional regulator YhcF (GntR family)